MTNAIGTHVLMLAKGETLHLTKGAVKNFKLTTEEDLEIFRAILVATSQRGHTRS